MAPASARKPVLERVTSCGPGMDIESNVLLSLQIKSLRLNGWEVPRDPFALSMGNGTEIHQPWIAPAPHGNGGVFYQKWGGSIFLNSDVF